MASKQTPAQSGANTPRSLGSFAALPRDTKLTSAEGMGDEPGPSSSGTRPIAISQSRRPAPFFGDESQIALSPPTLQSLNQRGEELTRPFYDMMPRSLGNEPIESRARDRPTRQPLDHRWTLLGQLLEDDGALKRRRASVAVDTANRPRAPSYMRLPMLPSNEESRSSSRRPLPLGSRSPSREVPPSRETILEPPNHLLSRYEAESPAGTELLPHFNNQDERLLLGSASVTAGSSRSIRRRGPASISREDSYDSSEDSDHNDNDDDSTNTQPSAPITSRFRLPTLSPLQKKVLKCSIAYTLGCLFTFVPAFSNILTDIIPLGSQQGPSPTGHMVATVAVYYNPAKTIGGMIEADMFCLLGAAFASFASLMATDSFWFFEVQPGWEWLADFLVLAWLGLAMTLIAWSKLWVGKPTFGSACSMTSIILFVVIVKEGGTEVLAQVLFITTIGITISNLICFSLWPESATTNLQQEMTKTLNSFSTLLKMLTSAFLLDDTSSVRRQTLIRAVEAHQKSFTSLKKVLAEARVERCDPRIQRTAKVYDEAVLGLNHLAQHFGGLRSGTKLQFELIQSRRKMKAKSTSKGFEENGKAVDMEGREDDDAKMAEALFGSLVDDVGPPMRKLSEVCVEALEQMSNAFQSVRHSDYNSEPSIFSQLKREIDQTLFKFESTSESAVMRLFRRGDGGDNGESQSNEALDKENETMLLVFFFIFTLKEFARDLMALTDVISAIYITERAIALEKSSWGWIWRPSLCCFPGKRLRSAWKLGGGSEPRLQSNAGKRPGIRRQISSRLLQNVQNRVPLFPKVKPHAPNTALRLSRTQLTTWGRIKQSIWALGQFFRQPEIKYSIKTGMAVAILAAPAFIESTRETFVEYRGEWALISCFVVLSPTVGGTNFLSLHRIMGTLIGATVAVIVFTLFKHQPVILVLCSFLYSLPCFYYIVNYPQYATSGRFVLLTYNLTCLFSYNSRDDNIPVLTVAQHRATAVTIGVIWAFFVSKYWWPFEARRELGRVLSEFCLNIGWFYQCLVSSYSVHPSVLQKIASGKGDSLIKLGNGQHDEDMNYPNHLRASIKEFMAMELHLQLKLIELQGLLAQTENEFRLKGPFPVALYRTILTSLQSILDMLHSLRCATTQEDWYTVVRRQFIIPVNSERRDMVGNVLLYFSTLSGAFQLKTPLPPYLPPAEQARKKLVDAVRQLDVVKNKNIKASKHLLFFAYVILMSGVIKELEFLGGTLQEAFGVIGESSSLFEALFTNYDVLDEEVGQPAIEDR
ncbi:putative membrane protein YGL140C [Saccharomyces cerevisiae S288c] [Rhizoctonia solani]|uniref:Putative membrane protein YGL140C [Saccharomyces cerevisiae S288c] n=1 Tax=Rhizoctonia solani TaxID=456999 RepID=A0A0K6FKE3_9AGAM|nr:putative membrane protein YGL140C [Saccharomyces cerevisiae S288c] [Rhizoctonia solani]